MFEMGFWEVILIFVILLIVVGPERLPKLARTVGLWVGKARTMVTSVRSEIEQELRVAELKESLHKQAGTEEFQALSNDVKSLSSEVKSMGSDFQKSIDKDATKVAESFSAPKNTFRQAEQAVADSTNTEPAKNQTASKDSTPPVKQADGATSVE